MYKLGLFLLFWSWAAWKRGDWVRSKQTLFILGMFLGIPLVIRILLLICYPSLFSSLQLSDIGLGIRQGFVGDLSMLALWGGGSLLLVNFPISSVSYRKWIGVFTIFIWDCYVWILLADLIYFRYIGRHTGPDIFNFFLSATLVLKTAFYSYKWVPILGTIWFAGSFYVAWKYMQREKQLHRGSVFYEVFCIGIIIFFIYFSERGYFFSKDPLVPQQTYVAGRAQGHFALNGVFSMVYNLMPAHYIRSTKNKLSHPSLNELSEEKSLSLAQQLVISSNEQVPDPKFPLQRVRHKFTYPQTKKHLIILAFESLDYRQIDFWAGTNYGATPHLDSLLKQGQLFDYFYSCSENSSLLGVGTVMSGLCWVSGIPYFSRGLEQTNQRGLGQLFTSAGYRSVFVRACEDSTMYIGPLSRLMGYDSFGRERIKKEYGKKQVYDAEALEVLADQFKKSKQPFSGFFFSTATHEPFDLWTPKELNPVIEKKFKNDPYLRALAYTDEAVGQFLRTLQENGLYEDTVFILVGDHPQREINHAGQEKYHVPFALIAPGIIPAKRSQTIGGQADVLPTIIDLFHISEPYAALGTSLLEDTSKEWAYVTQEEGNDFSFITPLGLIPENQPSSYHQQMVGLNTAAYTILHKNAWVQ